MRFLLIQLGIFGCLALGWLVYQDSLSRTRAKPSDAPSAPLPVEVMRVQEQAIAERAELVGSLEAAADVSVRARVSGYVTRLPVDVGDPVTVNQVVVELDDSQYQEQVQAATATLDVAHAQLKAKRARLAQAERDADRERDLAAKGVSTEAQFEQVQAALDVAEAEVELEVARVAEAQSQLTGSRLALDEMQIKSPLDGYVAERLIDVGDLAQPNEVLLRIVRIDVVRTLVHVVERDYEKVRPGQQATITVDAFPKRSFEGTVIRKAPVLDPETRTAAVQIEIQNPNRLLKPGMHARVALVFAERPATLVVPIAALRQQDEQQILFVVSGKPPVTTRQEVVTGVNDGEFVEILSGVKLEDRVVTLGGSLVRHGQPVTPVEVPWPDRPEFRVEATGG